MGPNWCAQRARARRVVLRGILQRSVSILAYRWHLRYCTCLHLRIQRVMCARPFQCAGEQVPRLEQSCLTGEFFSTDVIRVLEDLGVDYLIPCVNTANVVKAIGEFSRGERPAVSMFRIAKSKNDYVEYTMHITGRRKKSRKKSKSESCVEKPEEKYIAFATNRSDIDVKCYSERWMIETGFRMIENQRVRTRSRSVTVRTLCFLYSLVLFNSWVLANAELTNNPSVFGGVYSKITQTDMKIIIMMQVLPWNGRYEEPPPGVSLAGSADVTCRNIDIVMSLPQ